MVSTKDIGWLAGLMEGEGHIGYAKRNREIRLSLQMTDADVMARVAKLLGCPVHGPYGPYGKGKKPVYHLAICGTNAAQWLMTIYTDLGIRRRAKAREILEIWKSQRARLPNGVGTGRKHRGV